MVISLHLQITDEKAAK